MSKTIVSKFYCLNCGSSIALPRLKSQMREKGHFKSIYCVCCRETYNHLEVREFDLDFDRQEFMEDLKAGHYKEHLLPPEK